MDKVEQAFQKLYQAGFEPRTGQVEMAKAAYRAFSNRQIAVLEGPTGVGKTFAYLIAGLLALKPKQKLVVATATVTLQEQLAEKDVPTILQALQLPLSVALAKGRKRYVCPQKLLQQEPKEQDLFGFAIESLPKTAPDTFATKQLRQLKHHFFTQTWDGDLDRWPETIDAHNQQQITMESAGCSQQHCASFRSCPYFMQRRQHQQAEILITNHHLLLSDIEIGTGSLLPSPEKALYVIDEAHHFPETAIDFFQAYLSFAFTDKWLKQLAKSLKGLKTHAKAYETQVTDIEATQLQLVEDMQTLVACCPSCQHDPQAEREHLLEQLSEPFLAQLTVAKMQSQRLFQQLSLLRQALMKDEALKIRSFYTQMLQALGQFVERSQQLWRSLHLLTQENASSEAPVAKWMTFPENTHEEKVAILHAALTSAAHFLPSLWWDKITNGMVLCSATLRALGSFDYFLQQTGLCFFKDTIQEAFPSSFDYSRAKLYVPKTALVPSGAALMPAYIDCVAGIIRQVIDQETAGVLILFTSFELMNQVYTKLDAKFCQHVLRQGEVSRSTLLTKHRQKVDAGKLSVLFGLQSFAEGIDLPGDYCRHVVITRLPFAVPTTPTERILSRWLEKQGKNPFYVISLPRASMKLTQYVGRLIRRPEDSGTITFCDRRIVNRPYSQYLLANMPDFQKVVE